MKYEELDYILERLNFFSEKNGWLYIDQGFHFFLKVNIEKDGYVDFYWNDNNLFGSTKLEDITAHVLFQLLDKSNMWIGYNFDHYNSVKMDLIRD